MVILKKMVVYAAFFLTSSVIGLGIFIQFKIEAYISENKQRFQFLDGRKRVGYTPYLIYDLQLMLFPEKKKDEMKLLNELFNKYGYPEFFSPYKDCYMIHSYFSKKSKDTILSESNNNSK